MLKIFKMLVKPITNRINDKKFIRYDFVGYDVPISTDKIDVLYGKKVYNDISRCGPRDVRQLRSDISDWCDKTKGTSRCDYVIAVDNNSRPYANFAFSRKEVAEEFKVKFLT